jgi:hypothetical protein
MTLNQGETVSTVLEVLCTDGPILEAFGIDTTSIGAGTTSNLALEFLRCLATGVLIPTSADTGFADAVGSLNHLAPPTRAELDALPLDSLAHWIRSVESPPDRERAAERFWQVFSPNAAGIMASWDENVARLRRQRLVHVEQVASGAPGGRVLFTSNVLLTSLDASDEQRWFYDHPTVAGADLASSEIVHGLVNLNEAMGFEKDRGTLDPGTTVDCILSVSVTHESLTATARREVLRHIDASGDLEHIAVYVFTESETNRLITEVLAPAADVSGESLTVFGVNGAYGRHYSFGKAIAALWRTVVDPGVDRTFKFDLDQVFPQHELVAETGHSALELLALGSRWGASGVDSLGVDVHLGMCAGALVNESDIGRGLFTPDINAPTNPPELPDLLFRKAVPQALSTQAEMMDRGDFPKGSVRQRVHVTGGTTGITIEALTRFRPFTPSFIARAEDQAYLFSVLGGPQPRLRTAHIPGLIMRHDKASVAAESVSDAQMDTTIGDYERTLLFTGYARAIRATDVGWLGPFTGSYISAAPLALTLIRLMLDVIDRSNRGEEAAAAYLLVSGVQRIARAYDLALAPGNDLRTILEDERLGWDRYYDAVEALSGRDDLVGGAQAIIAATRVR